MSLSGKVAFVTGGLSGIGFEASRNLLIQGVEKLGIFDVNTSDQVLQKIRNEYPSRCICFRKTDVSNRTEVECSFKEMVKEFGHIDILINSAGVFDETNFENTFSVNVFGTINTTQTAIELMSIEKGGKGGIIANIASVCGLDAFFAQPIYNATKHAVLGFTRSFGDPFFFNIYGIKFVVICPGITDTPFIENLDQRFYRKDLRQSIDKVLGVLPHQSAEVCGKILVELLENATNGSIWKIDDGKAHQVILKNHWLPDQ